MAKPGRKASDKIPAACREAKQKKNRAKQLNRLYAVSYAFGLIMKDATRDEVMEAVMDKYNYSERTAKDIYIQANKSVERWKSMDVETIKSRNLQRLDKIVNEAMEDGDRNNALKAIDIQNKTASVYVEKKDVNVSSDVIKFEFGS